MGERRGYREFALDAQKMAKMGGGDGLLRAAVSSQKMAEFRRAEGILGSARNFLK